MSMKIPWIFQAKSTSSCATVWTSLWRSPDAPQCLADYVEDVRTTEQHHLDARSIIIQHGIRFQKSTLLVCNWLHSVGQNHFYVMMLLNRDSAIQRSSRRFCTVYKSEKSNPLEPSGRRDIPSGCPTVQSIICPDSSGPSSVSRSFKLFHLASVQTFQKHVRTTLSVWPAMGFLSKTRIWEDRCNHPNNVDSHPDVLIHKASYAFKIQTSGWQPSWSGRSSYLIWKVRAAKVRSSGWQGNTVRTPLKTGKNSCKILGSPSHSCPSKRLMSTVWTTLRFIKPNAHLNLQLINRGP